MLRFRDLQAKGDDMPRYDFDQPRERKNTSSIKYDAAALLGKREGLVPLWGADMDFPTAQPIIDALVDRAKNGIFGYEFASPAYFAAVQGWLFGHFGWETDWKWIVRTPGCASASRPSTEALDSTRPTRSDLSPHRLPTSTAQTGSRS